MREDVWTVQREVLLYKSKPKKLTLVDLMRLSKLSE